MENRHWAGLSQALESSWAPPLFSSTTSKDLAHTSQMGTSGKGWPSSRASLGPGGQGKEGRHERDMEEVE